MRGDNFGDNRVTTSKLTERVNSGGVTTCDNFLGVVTHVVTLSKVNKIKGLRGICDNCDNFFYMNTFYK